MTPAVIDGRHPVWPKQFLPITGVVYVATGGRFIAEAARAAAQLRRTNPGLPICFITDAPDDQPKFWDHLVVIQNPNRTFRDKLLMGACPYERFLYLDTDTHVVRPLPEMLTVLQRFDFAGHQLFEGHDCPLPGIPDAFPEFNGGVLGFRRSPAMADFFPRWLENYDSFYALNRDGHYHYSNVGDQKALRLTVWQQGVSVAVLGPEYNFTPQHIGFACAEVRILHGRPEAQLAQLDARINGQVGNRVYVPQLDSIISANPPAANLRRLWLAVTLQLIRKAGVALSPQGLRDWLRRSSLVSTLFLRNRFSETTTKPDSKWQEPPRPSP